MLYEPTSRSEYISSHLLIQETEEIAKEMSKEVNIESKIKKLYKMFNSFSFGEFSSYTKIEGKSGAKYNGVKI